MAHVQRLLEGELAQVGEDVVVGHRLLGHGQRERRGGLGGGALAGDELVGQPLEQLRPQVEDAAAELARLLGAPGEVGDGRGAIGHRPAPYRR